MARFQKGNSAGGRKKGSVNKNKGKVKEIITNFLENNLSRVQEDLDSLEPRDRLKIILEMASFVVPKMKSVEVDVDVQHNTLGLSNEDYIELENQIIELNDNGNGTNEIKE
jgi:hypothetical protein